MNNNKATIIDGKSFANELKADIKIAVENIVNQNMRKPAIAVILASDDPASKIYVEAKARAAKELGINSFVHILNSNTKESELLSLLDKLNNDPNVDAILVQLPLPEHIDKNKIIKNIKVEKDVDGFHPYNVGELFSNSGNPTIPCTPYGAMLLLKKILGNDIVGKSALIIGRSNIVGRPMAALLIDAGATVSVAHSKTKEISTLVGVADIIVVAIGKAEFIKGEWLKPGTTILDVGINRTILDGKNIITGDVEFNKALNKAVNLTPVPGGIGPMTIAMLMYNTIKCYCGINNIDMPEILHKYKI